MHPPAPPRVTAQCSARIAIAAVLLAFCSIADEPLPGDRLINFAAGQWDRSEWLELRQPNQQQPRQFSQGTAGLRMTMDSYHEDDYRNETDNAVLAIDTGTTEGQVEISFKAGPGFNRSSTPGIAISPAIVDGVAVKLMGFFMAEWGFGGWFYAPGEKRPVQYKFVAQQCRPFALDQRHVLRCRYSKKRQAVAIQIDDSDVLVVKFIGHPTLGSFDLELNSMIGIWGCHGVCEFYEMKILQQPTLPFDRPVTP